MKLFLKIALFPFCPFLAIPGQQKKTNILNVTIRSSANETIRMTALNGLMNYYPAIGIKIKTKKGEGSTFINQLPIIA